MRYTAAELAALLPGSRLLGDAGALATGAAADSRELRPGDLFVALPGSRADGHDFLPQAWRAGATVALVRRDPGPLPPGRAAVQVTDSRQALEELARAHRRRWGGPVVAVTGSVGKTSTRDLVAAVLATRFHVLRAERNFNTEVGVPLTLLRLEPGHEAAVLELAMRGPGEIRTLARIAEPETGVVTRIAPVHLEFLGSMEAIARAKGELLEELPPSGRAVLSADDPWQAFMASLSRAPVLWYGRSPAAQVRCQEVEAGAERSRFLLRLPDGRSVRVELPHPGEHMVWDATAAAAVGLVFGLEPEEVAAGLARAELTGHRNRLLRAGAWTVLDDCYNSSPASLEAALAVLARAPGRRWAVLGDMLELGPEAERYHREAGERAGAYGLALLVAVGAWAETMAEAARRAGVPEAIAVADAGEAAALARERVRPGDTVLVKGSRALELERVVEALSHGA
ncbi:MAG: UDP-N-acetylmuramoyl-tripeptide--D-alanyl-D-alanine ligase [Clostridia bacterium]|nr:UDP-N-acetylmuramoyl-tripeptide--D-alanyl-D-alanine ligase [Clostridia bacterium]